ncbi:MAG TPA: GNAT family N-acetyltransferase [Campylobacterales bacterium]|nr:GNAT family N-acetyltransferase [Campylobacterales bacterium]
MTPTLYFLRSSENKITKDMTKYAHKDAPNLNIYYDFYGLTPKDLGLYALVDGTIVGAIWTRELEGNTPQLSLAVLPEYRSKGVATAMMEQFLVEISAVSEVMITQTYANEQLIKFYTKFGFTQEENSLMKKTLQKKEIIRPTDGYDPRKWMD